MHATAYVINLDRSGDRLRHMEGQAGSLGLRFERVAGVDGAALSAEELDRYRQISNHRPLTPGEIGCWLSHRKAWALICSRDEAWGLVLEDDILISPDLPAILGDMHALPQDADIIKLDTFLGAKIRLARGSVAFGSRALHRLRGASTGSAGYLVSKRICRWLLDNTETFAPPIDLYLFSPKYEAFRRLATYVMVPSPVVQQQLLARLDGQGAAFESLISDPNGRRRTLPVHEKVVREVLRIFGQARDLFVHRRAIDWR